MPERWRTPELEAEGPCSSLVQCGLTRRRQRRGRRPRGGRLRTTRGRLRRAAGIDGEHGKPTAEATLGWRTGAGAGLVDLTGTFSCLRHELPAIVASGGWAHRQLRLGGGPSSPQTPSSACHRLANHGVVGLTKAAAVGTPARAGAGQRHLSGHRRHADVPGLVPPELVDRLVRTNTWSGGLAEASEIARTSRCGCRDDASGYLTGQAITVDEGPLRRAHRIPMLSTLVIDAPTEVRDRTVEFWAGRA